MATLLVPAKLLGQFGQPGADAQFRASQTDSHRLADLMIGEPGKKSQTNRVGLYFGQIIQQPLQLLAALPLEQTGKRRLGRFGIHDLGSLALCQGGMDHLLRAADLPRSVAAAEIQQNRPEPRAEVESRIECLASGKDGEERLLNDVFGQGLITEHSRGNPEKRWPVTFDERVKAAKFALLEALHQFAVFDAHATILLRVCPDRDSATAIIDRLPRRDKRVRSRSALHWPT